MNNEPIKDDIVLNDDELVCILTETRKKATSKELVLQSVIQQMNDEYGFELSDMQRDFSLPLEDEEGRTRRVAVDLAIFESGMAHDKDHLARLCFVFDSKVAAEDKKKGVDAILNPVLSYSDCEFALWTNGDELYFYQRVEDEVGNIDIQELSDFLDKALVEHDIDALSDAVVEFFFFSHEAD